MRKRRIYSEEGEGNWGGEWGRGMGEGSGGRYLHRISVVNDVADG